ncbi:hypothetical protein PISL3812_08800 [Talaromyces islandicus]|uniref:Uncharacterized protein n=1 Tax=Talaromyces islandicus TaxID=28573 RepID=A0A0U1M887_TALIS|nr:hypothetical protein PISL3812_08800 [Talaromyces islandicus]
MNQAPSEIIFSLAPLPGDKASEPCVFRYDNGAMKLRAPRIRGRPRGSTKKTQISSDESGDIQNDYDFVNVTAEQNHVDQDARVKIRKRVMVNHMRLKRVERQKYNEHSRLPATRVNSLDPFDVFPFHLEPYMHDILKFYITSGWKSFYSIEKYADFNPIDYWLPVAFRDGAFLHALLGCADSHIIGKSQSRAQNRLRAIRHLNAAISIVNRRIADLESVTDETLLIVATIAIIEKSRGAHDNWQIHMEGLHNLVNLRGGLSCLESKPLLMGKLYRADLCGSLDAAQTPYFSGRYIPVPSATSNTGIRKQGFQRLEKLITLNDTLKYCINALADAMQSMKRLKSRKGGRAEAAQVRFWFTATQYTLLSVDYDPSQTSLRVCQIALILFSICLIDEQHTQLPVCDMLIAKLQSLWEQGSFRSLPAEFTLWTIFLASCAVSDDQLKVWCLSALRTTATVMGVHSWEEVSQVLEKLLWDSELFDYKYLDIWNNTCFLRKL